MSTDKPARRDINALFAKAEAEGRTGRARKVKPVDARPAEPGEIVVTQIAGEGQETRSKPAGEGDMVVRNRCPETGNESYLVSSAEFAKRYEGPLGATQPGGWREYRPIAPEVTYFTVGPKQKTFVFTAPWGEDMLALPGDAIIRNPSDPADTYRVAWASFLCTYEIVSPSPRLPSAP